MFFKQTINGCYEERGKFMRNDYENLKEKAMEKEDISTPSFELKIPTNNKFNPRIANSNTNDERFFAFESQRAHH